MKRSTQFDPLGNRYQFDEGPCRPGTGWAQVDTKQSGDCTPGTTNASPGKGSMRCATNTSSVNSGGSASKGSCTEPPPSVPEFPFSGNFGSTD